MSPSNSTDFLLNLRNHTHTTVERLRLNLTYLLNTAKNGTHLYIYKI
jgi:hypothetical protein